MTKRQKFLFVSVVLSIGFVGIQVIDFSSRVMPIIGLSILTTVLFAQSLKEGLGKNSTLLVLVLPTLFTASVGLFWFLLPLRFFTQMPIIILYFLGVYILLLTSNIFTVAAIRTIALVRAAQAVGFFMTLVTSFLLLDTVFSLRLSSVQNALLTFLVSFPLFLQGLWSATFEERLKKEILISSAVSSAIVSQVSFFLSFWPVTIVAGSLFLTTSIYVLLGLGQAQAVERLFKQTVREYLTVGLVVFLVMFLTTTWGA